MNGKLVGITWDHPRGYRPLEAACAEYQARTGVETVWERRSLQDFGFQPILDLDARYDLLVIDHPHIGQAAREGCLLPLDTAARRDELERLSADSVGPCHASYLWQGRQWALAIDAAAQVAAYRPDLIAAPPMDWDAARDLARRGQMLWPLKPGDAFASFLTLAANLGSPCAEESGPFVDPEVGLQVIAFMQDFVSLLPERCLSMSPIDVFEEMSRGSGAAYCPLAFGYSTYAIDGFRPKRLRFVDMPAARGNGPVGSLLGGAGVAVSHATSDPQAAIDVAFWLASAECQSGTYLEADGQPASLKAWTDEAANEHTHGFFRDTRSTLQSAYVRPRHDGYTAFQTEASEIVHGGLRGRMKAAETVAELNRAFEASNPIRPLNSSVLD